MLEPVERTAGTNFEKAFLVWGIVGVQDDSAAYAPRSDDASALVDENFDAGDAVTQVRMLKMCEVLSNKTELVTSMEPCPMAAIQTKAKQLGYGWPLSRAEMERTVVQVVRVNAAMSRVLGIQAVTDPTTGVTERRVAWMKLTFLTTIPFRKSSYYLEKEYNKWLAFLDEFSATTFDYNVTDSFGNVTSTERAPPKASSDGLVTAACWVRMATELQAINGTATSIMVSLAFAVFATVIFTGDIVVSIAALFNMVAIILCVIAILVALGIEFGIVEAISLTILVGISVDFSLHLAEAFTRSHFTHRGLRGVDAVSRVGYPIFSAAFTTLSAVLPMLWCQITILVNFAQIIPLCISASLIYGLHFFAPILMILGPNTAGGGSGKWCFQVGKLPNLLFATQTRRMIFLIACGLLFGWCLPATRERILDDIGATMFTGVAIGFAVASSLAVVLEEVCARRGRKRNAEETETNHHRDENAPDTDDGRKTRAQKTKDRKDSPARRRPVVTAPRRVRFPTLGAEKNKKSRAANAAAAEDAAASDSDSIGSDTY